MGKLIYAMITSLDGYTEAMDGGGLGSSSDDPEVHSFIGEAFRHVGTYLYGRRMYETMVFWETVHQQPDVPAHILEYGEIWRSANKIVYSTTLKEVSSEKTRIEPTFAPEDVRKLKAETDHDISIDGPTIAAQAIKAGLVDEIGLFMTTSVVGGGTRFFPDGFRLDLDLLHHKVFSSGLIYAYYRVAR